MHATCTGGHVHISMLCCQAKESQQKHVDSFHETGGQMENSTAQDTPFITLVYQTVLSTYTCRA